MLPTRTSAERINHEYKISGADLTNCGRLIVMGHYDNPATSRCDASDSERKRTPDPPARGRCGSARQPSAGHEPGRPPRACPRQAHAISRTPWDAAPTRTVVAVDESGFGYRPEQEHGSWRATHGSHRPLAIAG